MPDQDKALRLARARAGAQVGQTKTMGQTPEQRSRPVAFETPSERLVKQVKVASADDR